MVHGTYNSFIWAMMGVRSVDDAASGAGINSVLVGESWSQELWACELLPNISCKSEGPGSNTKTAIQCSCYGKHSGLCVRRLRPGLRDLGCSAVLGLWPASCLTEAYTYTTLQTYTYYIYILYACIPVSPRPNTHCSFLGPKCPKGT